MGTSQLDYGEHGPVRAPGCSQQLYRYAQTRWTRRLFVQMTLYVIFLLVSMGAGGMMPWILQHTLGYLPFHAGASSSSTGGAGSKPALQRVYREEPGYSYTNSNRYTYCKKTSKIGGNLPRGYPAPPLSPKGSQIFDAWHHQPVQLQGIAWPGLNQQPPGLEGLATSQLAAMEATDLHAIVYQLKLLGFNTVKLPFSFQALKAQAANQTVPCKPSSKAAWARRATDPAHHSSSVLDAADLPDPSVFLQPRKGTCNSYLPGTNGLGRLLWTVKYLVANGMYIVLSYQPAPGETVHQDRDVFALAWLSLWTPITCLDNFGADIRGRLMLDLLNEPSRLNGGIGWSSDGAKPGLAKLYLTAMDGIEGVTPRDALYLLQGSAVSYHWATDAGGGLNAYGLSPGDGFVLDDSAVTAYKMSSPKLFLSQLLQRPYSNRVLLAPHLLGPDASGAVLDSPDMLVNKMASSWGLLASEGFCNATDCFRLPVVAGEIGSRLDSEAEQEYYSAVSAYAGLFDTSSGVGSNNNSSKHLSGWIWSGYSNVTGPGPILEGDVAQFDWTTVNYLSDHFGLKPWYKNPAAWLNHSSSQRQADADSAAAAAAAANAAKAGGVSQAGNFTGTLEKLYHKAAADTELKGSAVLPALADAAAAAAAAASNASVTARRSAAPVSNGTATVAVPPAPAAAPVPAPTPAVDPPRLPAPAMAVAPPTATSPAPTPFAASPAPAAVTKPTTPSDSSISSTADVSSSSSSTAGGSSSSSQAPAPAAVPASLGESQQPSQQASAAAPVANTPAPMPDQKTAPDPAATPNGMTPAPSTPVLPPADSHKDAAPAAQQPPAAPSATTSTTISGSSSGSSTLPPATATSQQTQLQSPAAAAPTSPPSQTVELTRPPQQEAGVPRPTADRPQVQQPVGPAGQQDTRLPLMRPDFLLDAAQHAAAHSTEPGSPPTAAAAPAGAAGAPVTAAEGRQQQAQTVAAPSTPQQQRQPQVPRPAQGRRRDRVYLVGQVPSAGVNAAAAAAAPAAAPVPLLQGPAPVPLVQGPASVPLLQRPAPVPVPADIDPFTQMLWDRRLGASGSALHQAKVAEGDYAQDAPPVLRRP